jgi:hypothetical protein
MTARRLRFCSRPGCAKAAGVEVRKPFEKTRQPVMHLPDPGARH